MTAPPTRATPKITLDQRAPSRQERSGGRLDDSAHLTHIWGFLEARFFFVHGRNPTTAKTRCRDPESGVGRNEARNVRIGRKTASNVGRGRDRETRGASSPARGAACFGPNPARLGRDRTSEPSPR